MKTVQFTPEQLLQVLLALDTRETDLVDRMRGAETEIDRAYDADALKLTRQARQIVNQAVAS